MEERLVVKVMRITLLTTLLVALLLVALFLQTYLILSDCSDDGVRASKWIDDIDRSSGCLSATMRTVGLYTIPIFWLVLSASLIFSFTKRSSGAID